MKGNQIEDLISAINKVMKGGIYVSDEIKEQILELVSRNSKSQNPIDNLSPREFEIFQLMGEGHFKSREIANKLKDWLLLYKDEVDMCDMFADIHVIIRDEETGLYCFDFSLGTGYMLIPEFNPDTGDCDQISITMSDRIIDLFGHEKIYLPPSSAEETEKET